MTEEYVYDGIFTKKAIKEMSKKQKRETIQGLDSEVYNLYDRINFLEEELERERKLNKELQLEIMRLQAQVEILKQGSITYILPEPSWRPIPNYIPFPENPLGLSTGDIIPPPSIIVC